MLRRAVRSHDNEWWELWVEAGQADEVVASCERALGWLGDRDDRGATRRLEAVDPTCRARDARWPELGQMRRRTAVTLPRIVAWSPSIGENAALWGSSQTLPSLRLRS